MCDLSVSLQLLRFKYRITRKEMNQSVIGSISSFHHTDADRNRKATPNNNNNLATLKFEHSTD